MAKTPVNPSVEPPPGGGAHVGAGGCAGSFHRRLVDSINGYAIHGLDMDGVVTSWNTGAQRLTGYEPDEIIGQSFARFHTTEDQAARLPQGQSRGRQP